jgi:hypothetical protein
MKIAIAPLTHPCSRTVNPPSSRVIAHHWTGEAFYELGLCDSLPWEGVGRGLANYA